MLSYTYTVCAVSNHNKNLPVLLNLTKPNYMYEEYIMLAAVIK